MAAVQAAAESSGGNYSSRTSPQRFPTQLVGLGFLVLLSFCPGLPGDFAFDDYPNIVENPALNPSRLTLTAFREALMAGESGPSGRPLASASFLANRLLFGPAPLSYKLVNLFIHLVNAALVFALIRVLQRSVSFGLENSRHLAALTAAVWALHPMQLTSVLYVVQRMNSLYALFVLLAMLMWSLGREQSLARTKPMDRRWWVACAACGLLGVLCKENAVLLPVYIALLEWTVFRFSGLAWARIPALLGAVVLPAVLAVWVLSGGVFAEAYLDRGLTAGQRLLTELRVLCYYLQQLLFPLPHEMALLHENWQVSTSILQPFSTLPALVFWIGYLGGAVSQWRRRPWLSLALLWFLAGHLLESTVVPLDLVYDHRNYLPSVGICLLMATMLHAGLRTRPRALLLAASGTVILLSLMTAYRAWQWHDELTLALLEAHHNPGSSRARYEIGRVKYNLFLKGLDPQGFEGGLAEMEAAVQVGDEDFLPLTAMISMYLIAKTDIPEELMLRLEAELSEQRPSGRRTDAVAILIKCQLRKDACPISPEPVLRAAGALLANPRATPQVKAETLEWLAVYYANGLQDYAAASRTIAGALEFAPENSGVILRQSELLLAVGQPDLARQSLAQIERRMSAWEWLKNPQLHARAQGVRARLARAESARNSPHGESSSLPSR